MAIQVRRGLKADLDKNKLRPGEPASPTDSKELFIAFAPGDVKKIATYEDMEQNIRDANESIITELTQGVNQATAIAQTATTNTNAAALYANEKGLLADQKAQQAQSIIDSATPIINTNLQATYADKATAQSGQSIQCLVADDGLIEITKIEGATYQNVTTVGKNLLPKTTKTTQTISGITFTPNADGSITINGTATAKASYTLNGAWDTTVSLFSIPAGTYTLKKTGNENVILYITYGTTTVMSSALADKTTTLSTAQPIAGYQIQVVAGTTLNNLIVYPQLELGSTSTTYEPFVPNSPSPDYPAPITNANNFDLVAVSKNIVTSAKFLASAQYNPSICAECDLVPDTWYTISLIVPVGEQYYTNEYLFSTTQQTITGDGTRKTATVKTKADISKSNTQHYSISNSGWILFKNSTGKTSSGTASELQIEFGQTATTYTPNKGSNKINIPYDLGALPDGKRNKIEKGTDGKTRHFNIKGNTALNSSNTFYYVSANTNTVCFHTTDITSLASSINLYCTNFKVASGSNDEEHVRFNAGSPPSLQIWINKSRLTGWNDSLTSTEKTNLFKTWLASNPITVQYELATPIETVIPDIYLTSYKSITNLFTNATVQPTITANFKSQLWSDSYKKDKAIAEAKSGADINNSTVTFTEATTDTDIASGDKLSTLFSKILKRFNTIATTLANKFDKSNIVNTDTVNDVNKVPSSAVTYALGGEIDNLANAMPYKLSNTTGYAQGSIGSIMVTGVDANTLIYTGQYYCQGVSTGLNYPVTTNGFLEVIGSSTMYTYQLYSPVGSTTPKLYMRQQYNGVWTTWESVNAKIAATYTNNLSGMTVTNLSINKKGNRVTVNGILGHAAFPTTQTTIFTINEASFLPTTNIQVLCEVSTSGHATMGVGLLTVSITGAVSLIQKVSSAIQISFSFSYDVD
jgi:hypothetical protein